MLYDEEKVREYMDLSYRLGEITKNKNFLKRYVHPNTLVEVLRLEEDYKKLYQGAQDLPWELRTELVEKGISLLEKFISVIDENKKIKN